MECTAHLPLNFLSAPLAANVTVQLLPRWNKSRDSALCSLVFSPRLCRAMAAPTAPSSSSSSSCDGEPNPNTTNLRPPASSRCIVHIKRFCTPAICFGAAVVNLVLGRGKQGREGWWWGWNGTDWSPPQVPQITSTLGVRIKSTHWGRLKKTDTLRTTYLYLFTNVLLTLYFSCVFRLLVEVYV